MNRTSLRFEQIAFENEAEPTVLIEMQPGQVQVWGVSLDMEEPEPARAVRLLSREEQERVTRLIPGRHRQQFIAAHAVLRVVLSRYCGERPQELIIEKTASGKPFLPLRASVRFNLTHSHGRALIAIAGDREVGIDLEKIRREVAVERLARRFLSTQDQVFIESGEPSQKHERFLQVWVAREAVFKAEGRGITFPLHHDHVELSNDGKEGRLIRGKGGPEGTDVPIRYLPLETGWVGAVAAEGTDWSVTYRALG